jgi:hypothetical protein
MGSHKVLGGSCSRGHGYCIKFKAVFLHWRTSSNAILDVWSLLLTNSQFTFILKGVSYEILKKNFDKNLLS